MLRSFNVCNYFLKIPVIFVKVAVTDSCLLYFQLIIIMPKINYGGFFKMIF